MGIVNSRFLKAVREHQHHYFGNVIDINYDWYQFVRLVSTHPQGNVNWVDNKKRVQLSEADTRPRLPKFARDVIEELQTTFGQNKTTLVTFAGFTSDHQSLEIHRDMMDVLYLQVLGEVRWSIWEPTSIANNENRMQPDQGKKIWERTLFPGDLVWVPRGVWHHVEPLGPRVGFSFGVEKQPDPASYI